MAQDPEVPVPPPPATLVGRMRWAVADALTVVRANLAHIAHVPEQLMDVTIQPLMFVLLFAYVFGSAITVPGGGSYRSFLMPGIFTQSLAFTAITTAVAVANNMAKGVIDRFRSLPMARSAVLLGGTAADLIKNVLAVAVMAGCGLLIGWRTDHGLDQTAAGIALLLLFGFAMSWLGTFIGLIVRQPETAQVFGFVFMFPLTFVANTFVPTAGMPRVLRSVANWNPLSATVAACRQLFGDPGVAPPSGAWPLHHAVLASAGYSLLLLAVFLPLAVYRYRTATAR